MAKAPRVAAAKPPAWRWSRLIAREQEVHWTALMAEVGGGNWMVIEKPGLSRLRLEAYFATEKEARLFGTRWGGRVERFAPKPVAPAAPVRVDARLEIAHDEKLERAAARLVIPYGMAFGSGEHATTLMLLRALSRARALERKAVLDLGTGSGILALAARVFGARRIAATDFDPAAIRTARANEALNFSRRLVRWEVADVRKLAARPKFDLILANLFSGILVESASRVARALSADGELWLSGVLRSQEAEVAAAFRRAGLRLLGTTRRGKWVMQRWGK